jgi:hypothetical protein
MTGSKAVAQIYPICAAQSMITEIVLARRTAAR